ncbi:MAG: methionine--tRNA ligase [Nitrospirae bacterium 13_1_40CM_4_62_6]|nr:MAG: methionine--tRNA ligase [Nitrospirae bacterium 13_1_40CM_4_62_6]
MSKTFYITTPIYYVNDVPHIGHAYTTVAADVVARYYRLRGYDVFFLTGLDEHGQKVQQAAAKAGIDPKAYCDQLAPKFQNLWKLLHISNDAFIRTTDSQHEAYVRTMLEALNKKGLIYQKAYVGWYCTFDERFWTEKDVENGLCPDCKRPVERLSEQNYFFRMSQYQSALVDYISAHPNFIQPVFRKHEVLGFLKSKELGDLSISRPKSRLSWGIELPFDHNFVTYVWFDALANYLSALEYLTPLEKKAEFWPADVHLIGKDILTTHAVYWSTILMALERPLPKTIFAHGWWTVNGEKMSKSRGNVVDPYAVVDELGADAFRYFLLREIPFGHDGDFSREALIGRINTDLANDLGNLLHRTLTMIERFAKGTVPQPKEEARVDHLLQHHAAQLPDLVKDHLEKLEFNRALESIWGVVQVGNQHIDKNAPWNLAKKVEHRGVLDTVLYDAAEALRLVALVLYPFVPQASEEMKRQLGLMLNFSKPLLSGDIKWGGLLPGTPIAKGKPLFPRIDTTKPQGDVRVSQDQPSTAIPSPIAAPQQGSGAPPITIEDFRKVQLKAAKVLSAERVPKSEKLLKLRVDLGGEQLQIVAGIGNKYEPESLIGRRVVVVANLKPAKLMGVESQGMVLAAGDKEVVGLVTILDDVEPGTKVK